MSSFTYSSSELSLLGRLEDQIDQLVFDHDGLDKLHAFHLTLDLLLGAGGSDHRLIIGVGGNVIL